MELLPNELENIIKEYIIYKPKTKGELQESIDLWCTNKNKALKKYGHISLWDTSLIKDMSYLFDNKKDFNDNINNWNVSSVINMHSMFWNAHSFNKPLYSWDVSSVTDMHSMFDNASSFNQSLNSWNVPSENDIVEWGTYTYCMFNKADSFDKNNASWYNFD